MQNKKSAWNILSEKQYLTRSQNKQTLTDTYISVSFFNVSNQNSILNIFSLWYLENLDAFPPLLVMLFPPIAKEKLTAKTGSKYSLNFSLL